MFTLTPEEIEDVMRHATSHEVQYCVCPCFDALVRLGNEDKALTEALAKRYDPDDDFEGAWPDEEGSDVPPPMTIFGFTGTQEGMSISGRKGQAPCDRETQ